MRLMIVSDIHGDLDSASLVLKAFNDEGCDRILLLGDILYHGPRNDLPSGYAPKEVISLLNPLKDKILCVRGNCDTEVDQMVLDFPVLADYSYIVFDGVDIFATHGHNYNADNCKNLGEGTVLLHGHTHVPAVVPFGNKNVYINPGSVSIPKENSPKSYIIYENKVFSFRRLEDGEEYRRYEL